jgi:hypothetical protein
MVAYVWLRNAFVCLLLALNLGCDPCRRFDYRPESVCIPPDGGAPDDQPFELRATVSLGKPVEVSCAVSVDAGVIELTVSGSDCQQGAPFGGTKPIVVKGIATCAIPPLEAGQYTVLGITRALNLTLSVGGDAGPGVPVCP